MPRDGNAGCRAIPPSARQRGKAIDRGRRVHGHCAVLPAASHSIVAGGLPEMSYTTRLMPRTSLMMRFDTVASSSCGSGAQCAVMKSVRLHRAQRHHVFVGAAIAHHAHRRFHRQEHGEGLREVLSYQDLPSASLVARSSSMKIASARRNSSAYSRFTSPRMRTPRPGAGKRMAVHHVARQAERHAQFAHFVLEQFAQRLEQLQVQRFRQAADVVVRLDGVRLLGLRAGRFDHVGIDRALRQPFGLRQALPLRAGTLRRTRGR